jgi:TldD protein
VKDRLQTAVHRSRAGYSELRVRRIWSSAVLVRDRAVEVATSGVESAGGCRCISPGTGWGVVGFGDPDRPEDYLLRAHELSLVAASRVPVALAPIPIRQLELRDTLPDDPREVTLAEKRRSAEALSAALFAVDRRIASARVLYRDLVVETWLATSEGSWLHELRSEASVAALAIAEEEGNVERAVGSFAAPGSRETLDQAETMVRGVGQRAVELLHATPVRPGRYTLVLDPRAAGALMHRAVAHFARPALPGADPDVLPMGTRVGPECLTVGDDPTAEGLRATSACDDEGTVTRRTVIIQNGVVTGHLHSRETAAQSGQDATGHARAGIGRGAPYPRATNTYLAQGRGARDDLLRGVSSGLYLSDVLACEADGDQLSLRSGSARMIRNGQLAEPVKGAQIDTNLLALLGRLDAVAGDFAWDSQDARCRDGSAGTVPVTTGAPHARLVDVAVGEGVL